MDPAIAFATTYYYGFVKLLCDAFDAGRDIEMDGSVWRGAESRQARLVILIPDDLSKTSKERAVEAARQYGLREALVRCPDRARVAPAWPGARLLLDIPTVLDTIQHIHPPSADATARAQAEAAALARFRQEVARRIANDPVCSRYATVHGWDWWQTAPGAPPGAPVKPGFTAQ